jgi:hypothetical protein
MKCIITIEDQPGSDDKDNVKVVLEFDPPITDETPSTLASNLALKVMESLAGQSEET